jgi:hypothetical protein
LEARERYFTSLLEKYDVVVDESVKSLIGPLTTAKKQRYEIPDTR